MSEVIYSITVFLKDVDFVDYWIKIDITPEDVKNIIGKWGYAANLLPENINPYASFSLSSLEAKALESYIEDEDFSWDFDKYDYFLECSEI